TGVQTCALPIFAAFDVARLFQAAPKGVPQRCLRLGRSAAEITDDRTVRLLRVHRKRPSRCGANERDGFAPVHSITSSRRIRIGTGTSKPSALARARQAAKRKPRRR